MLVGGTVDEAAVIHRALVLFSLLCCTLLLTSLALFAHDQVRGASRRQTVAAASPALSVTAARPARQPAGQPRRFIDGAAATLTAPFAGIVSSDDPWVARGIPIMIGLLVYGLGAGMAARFALGGRRLGQS